MLLAMLLAMVVQGSAPQVQVISREMMSHVEAPKQAVARSAAEWAALWREHAGATAPPAIDLASRTVVAIFLGTRTSGGYGVEITGTRRSGETLVVQWQERRP